MNHFFGALLEPLNIGAMPLLFGRKSVSGPPVGSPATIGTMLDFAAHHGVEPLTIYFPMDRVNNAMAHLRSGKARYRMVLDRSFH
ncbi:MAG: alcohol dehydrogenase [Verrucomicrobiales bacterium]|nr:alcohol dehydrogenase [Verrucomicrobiales bacterium]